ncbi:UNVERIFIED_CONTAM: hypothetical protein DES50_103479 [Williamsia faeni]
MGPSDEITGDVRNTRDMTIEHFSLVADGGWADLAIDQYSPKHFWTEGGLLADAPVNVDKTFNGVSVSTKVNKGFHLNGLRLAPNYSGPRRHQNLDQLIFVFAGELRVNWGANGEEGARTIRPGQFWVTTAETPHRLTAGPEGAIFVETWSKPIAELETYWHDEGWIHN